MLAGHFKAQLSYWDMPCYVYTLATSNYVFPHIVATAVTLGTTDLAAPLPVCPTSVNHLEEGISVERTPPQPLLQN